MRGLLESIAERLPFTSSSRSKAAATAAAAAAAAAAAGPATVSSREGSSREDDHSSSSSSSRSGGGLTGAYSGRSGSTASSSSSSYSSSDSQFASEGEESRSFSSSSSSSSSDGSSASSSSSSTSGSSREFSGSRSGGNRVFGEDIYKSNNDPSSSSSSSGSTDSLYADSAASPARRRVLRDVAITKETVVKGAHFAGGRGREEDTGAQARNLAAWLRAGDGREDGEMEEEDGQVIEDMDGVVAGSPCFATLQINATAVDLEAYYNKAVNYTLMVTFVSARGSCMWGLYCLLGRRFMPSRTALPTDQTCGSQGLPRNCFELRARSSVCREGVTYRRTCVRVIACVLPLFVPMNHLPCVPYSCSFCPPDLLSSSLVHHKADGAQQHPIGKLEGTHATCMMQACNLHDASMQIPTLSGCPSVIPCKLFVTSRWISGTRVPNQGAGRHACMTLWHVVQATALWWRILWMPLPWILPLIGSLFWLGVQGTAVPNWRASRHAIMQARSLCCGSFFRTLGRNNDQLHTSALTWQSHSCMLSVCCKCPVAS